MTPSKVTQPKRNNLSFNTLRTKKENKHNAWNYVLYMKFTLHNKQSMLISYRIYFKDRNVVN